MFPFSYVIYNPTCDTVQSLLANYETSHQKCQQADLPQLAKLCCAANNNNNTTTNSIAIHNQATTMTTNGITNKDDVTVPCLFSLIRSQNSFQLISLEGRTWLFSIMIHVLLVSLVLSRSAFLLGGLSTLSLLDTRSSTAEPNPSQSISTRNTPPGKSRPNACRATFAIGLS